MTRRRRAAALLGLALLLGVLAASDVAGREAALRRRLGPTVRVVVVRAPLRPGERALDVVAVAAADAVVAGVRVDVLVTYDGRDGTPGATRLALADAEVLAARTPPGADGSDDAAGLPRVLATLRV